MMPRKSSYWGYLIVCLFMSCSCSGRPSNVLDDDEMVSLMVDMELAEAYTATQSISSNDRNDIGKKVLQAHGVSEETLDTTLAWYGRNMDTYSELFEKVDKEINKQRNKYMEVGGEKPRESDNLWIYSDHLVLSPLSGHDALYFSIPNPSIDKGDILNFSLFLPNSTTVKGTLGVEYNDGGGEAVFSNLPQNKNKLSVTLQTDTGRKVSKIYGIMHVKDKKSLPLYIDSISLHTEPYDSLNYRNKKRSQKSYFNNQPKV